MKPRTNPLQSARPRQAIRVHTHTHTHALTTVHASLLPHAGPAPHNSLRPCLTLRQLHASVWSLVSRRFPQGQSKCGNANSPQNRRIITFGKAPQDRLVQLSIHSPPCPRTSLPHPHAPSDGDSRGSLHQCLTALSEKKLFLNPT